MGTWRKIENSIENLNGFFSHIWLYIYIYIIETLDLTMFLGMNINFLVC